MIIKHTNKPLSRIYDRTDVGRQRTTGPSYSQILCGTTGATFAKDPRPARFRTTARDPRHTTRLRSIQPVIAKAPPPADQVWWTDTQTGRRRDGSISQAGSGCGPMLESHSPAASAGMPASSTLEPERLRRVPSFTSAPSWVAELKKAAHVAATPRPTRAYLTRTASAEMLTQLGEMGI